MVNCSIRNCKNRSMKGSSISFYTFPRNESVANEWLRYCGPNTSTKKGRVCSKHFLPSDYIKPILNLPITMKKGRQLKPDIVPTLHLDSIDKENTLKVMVEIKPEIIDTTENVNYLPQCIVIPIQANEVAEPPTVTVKSEKTVTITRSEYASLIKSKNELVALKKNLEKMFTPGQLRCLMTPDKNRVQWSAEDIAAAVALKSISQKCYRYLRHIVGIPLPAFSTLRKWASTSEILEDSKPQCEIQSQENEQEKTTTVNASI